MSSAAEHAALDGRPMATTSSGLTVRLGSFFEDLLDLGLDGREAASNRRRNSTSSMSGGGQARVLQAIQAGVDGALDQVRDQGLELGPGPGCA